jgi:hypothetical protein
MSDCRGQSLENSLSFAVSVVRFSLRQMELSVVYLYLHVLVFTGNRENYISGRFTKTFYNKAATNIFFLIQAGYQADFVFRTCVQAINNIYNRSGSQGNLREADPEFYRLVSLLLEIQRSGAAGMRVEEGPAQKDGTVFILRKKRLIPEIAAKISTAKRLLGLNPDENEFKIAYGSTPRDDNEIAVLSRSMLEIIVEMASYIEVPEVHLAEGRSYATILDQMDVSAEFGPLIEIHSDESKPRDDFVAVEYHDNWFWIDDRDLRSKRMFSFLLLLFAFTEKESAIAPLVTIPTG